MRQNCDWNLLSSALAAEEDHVLSGMVTGPRAWTM